jgi:hypothetical protein
LKIYSVTQVLSVFQDFSMIREDRLQAAASRGTHLHAAFAAYALGVWFPGLPEEEKGYFDSFKKWFDRFVIKVIAVEEKIMDEALGFSGTIDFVGVLSIPTGAKNVCVLDWKSPLGFGRTWEAQASAYFHLAEKEKYKPTFAGILQPDPEGEISKMTWVKNQTIAFAAFLSALNCFRFFKS